MGGGGGGTMTADAVVGNGSALFPSTGYRCTHKRNQTPVYLHLISTCMFECAKIWLEDTHKQWKAVEGQVKGKSSKIKNSQMVFNANLKDFVTKKVIINKPQGLIE